MAFENDTFPFKRTLWRGFLCSKEISNAWRALVVILASCLLQFSPLLSFLLALFRRLLFGFLLFPFCVLLKWSDTVVQYSNPCHGSFLRRSHLSWESSDFVSDDLMEMWFKWECSLHTTRFCFLSDTNLDHSRCGRWMVVLTVARKQETQILPYNSFSVFLFFNDR